MNQESSPAQRCPWAIKFGASLTTRCLLVRGHEEMHEGRGLVQFPYQRIEWLAGDRREFATGRDDIRAWEEE